MATADEQRAIATTPSGLPAGAETMPEEKSHVVMTPGTCGGRPRIAGTRIRVRDVVEWTDLGQTAYEIVASFPELSLGDVYAALAFYHDHREMVDRQIREDDAFVETLIRERKPGVVDRFRAGEHPGAAAGGPQS